MSSKLFLNGGGDEKAECGPSNSNTNDRQGLEELLLGPYMECLREAVGCADMLTVFQAARIWLDLVAANIAARPRSEREVNFFIHHILRCMNLRDTSVGLDEEARSLLTRCSVLNLVPRGSPLERRLFKLALSSFSPARGNAPVQFLEANLLGNDNTGTEIHRVLFINVTRNAHRRDVSQPNDPVLARSPDANRYPQPQNWWLAFIISS
eukprot:Protomagalhaensia_sp_Gyna_25__5048@NODE_566_length_3110_cov_7_143601_g440_i0_p2_GENE_NODE_566_length_3110_cov_7_143601_g440_i0NODE_566_length_3110_cov_7_143601_g440_i0_p2_ORF_typecomplete_len209_score13_43_NODE_566_length_3110_cov_7_143601_g440_i024573083